MALRAALRLVLLAALAAFVYGAVTRDALVTRSPVPFLLLALYSAGSALLTLRHAPALARERLTRLSLGPEHQPALEQSERLAGWVMGAFAGLALLAALR